MSPDSIELDSPSGLMSAANGTNYTMISHADFAGDVEPLHAHYDVPGFRTVLALMEWYTYLPTVIKQSP